MKTDFTFVDPVYDSIFTEAQQKDQARAIYFGKGVDLEEANGKLPASKPTPYESSTCVLRTVQPYALTALFPSMASLDQLLKNTTGMPLLACNATSIHRNRIDVQ